MSGKAVFLDRDGVINKVVVRGNKPYPPSDLKEFEFTDNIKETLEKLKKEGFYLLIFSNQPDVARGKISIKDVELINEYILKNLPIDRIYCCYHDDADNCECRKPKTGMIMQARRDYNLDLKKCFVVGDRWRDIEAGKNAGCKTIFVDYGYDEGLKSKPDFVVKEVRHIIKYILKKSKGKDGDKR
jgi:D-glycero-D-manno-heptose 1,7-bisphosphate phosphatase